MSNDSNNRPYNRLRLLDTLPPLYHSYATRFLIVQSFVSIANTDPDYFQTPAPNWDWGCRYSRVSFEKMIRSKNWNIKDIHFNLLEGNGRKEDMGSFYALVEK